MTTDVRGGSQQQAGSASFELEPHVESGTRRGLVGVGGVLPPVLDACCGSQMFWFDKDDPRAVFLDERKGIFALDERKGRAATEVKPDIIGDFTNLPFPDSSFYLVVFDPPHLLDISEKCRLAVKYGKLFSDWRDELAAGFRECFRVLRPNGVLVFKWSEAHIPIKDVLALSPHSPLFGNKAIGISGRVPSGSTHWICFLKGGGGAELGESERERHEGETQNNQAQRPGDQNA